MTKEIQGGIIFRSVSNVIAGGSWDRLECIRSVRKGELTQNTLRMMLTMLGKGSQWLKYGKPMAESCQSCI